MVLVRVFNRLRGQVRLRVSAAFPERVLNLCGQRQLALWDVCWVSPTEFCCSMSRGDWHRLRRATEKLECTITAEGRSGAPYFLLRLRRRYVLAAGLALWVLGLTFGQFFIWDFRIDGNETVTDEAILRILQENGIGLGTFGFAIDSEDLRNHILLQMPELAWIAVNVSGCQAQVQVRERVAAPVPADRYTPANVVARREGLVLEMRALGGLRQVLPGTVVQEGQLLISGVEDTGTVGARLTAAMGSVTARTWYTLETKVPLAAERRQTSGEEKTVLSLIFGSRRVKIYGNSSYSLKECDKIIERERLRFFGLPLPITVERERLRFLSPAADTLTAEEAQRRGEAALRGYLAALVEGRGTVSSAICSSRERDGVLTVTLTAECREEIGRQVPIYTHFQ